MPSRYVGAESISISDMIGDHNSWLYWKLRARLMNGKNIPSGDCCACHPEPQSPEELSEDVKSSVNGSRSSHKECSGAVWHGWSCVQGFVCHCFLLSWACGQGELAVRSTCHLVFVWGNHMALSAGTATILSLSWWPGKTTSWWWTPVFVCKAPSHFLCFCYQYCWYYCVFLIPLLFPFSNCYLNP